MARRRQPGFAPAPSGGLCSPLNHHPEGSPGPHAANAAAVTTLQRQQQQATQQQVSEPAVNDLADPLTGQVNEVCTAGYKWVAAYKGLAHKQLPRRL